MSDDLGENGHLLKREVTDFMFQEENCLRNNSSYRVISGNLFVSVSYV